MSARKSKLQSATGLGAAKPSDTSDRQAAKGGTAVVDAPPPSRRTAGKAAGEVSGDAPSPGQRPLNKEEIIRSALALIDEKGLEPFSMRALAQRIGVYPTAIYWYTESKNAILSDVAAYVLRDVMPVADPQDWRGWIRDLLLRYRAAIFRHPNVSGLIGAQIVSNTALDFNLIDSLLRVLAEAGFAGDSMVRAYNAVFASMLGFVTLEFAPVPAKDGEAWARRLRTSIEQVDAGQFPHLHAYKAAMMNKSFVLRWENGAVQPMTDSFEMYVAMMLGGLEKLLSPDSNGKPAGP